MSDKRATQRIVDACVGMGRYQPHELLTWMVADVLAGFGVRCGETPPADLRAWLLDASGEYARAVAARPFEDVLGEVYQSLASRGQAFTGKSAVLEATRQSFDAVRTERLKPAAAAPAPAAPAEAPTKAARRRKAA